MNIIELIKSDVSIDDTIIQHFIKNSDILPELVKKLLCVKPGFYNTEYGVYRLLHRDEMLVSNNYPDFLDVNVLSKSILPLFDIQSHDFICYHLQKKHYFILNVKEEFEYFECDSLEELINELEKDDDKDYCED